jgi:peptidylprolyl isomerase
MKKQTVKILNPLSPLFSIALILGLVFSLSSTCANAEDTPPVAKPSTAPSKAAKKTEPAATQPDPKKSEGTHKKMDKKIDLSVDSKTGLSNATVTIKMDNGVIKYKFYPEEAPKTVARMVELIEKGFYNGLIFHRVIPSFVAQGGDPTGTGMGGTGQKLQAEFNKRKHVEGAVAMARAADPNSADCQFYITLAETPHLDSGYTVFGLVTEGMDIVKKIKVGDKMLSVSID